ncbi:cytochrome c [Rubellimicrobium sp. CFH 75288]|uniref:cytochrome c n=1 Tax=Rubellimicrobium sp. CFH 75288 TaxID=2697034 RepID=UPI001411DD8C|nr:cytochrome c [Rubellimicrobium sp. CFH 75288]NAZ36890.1 c-type cytochrome [Rubellimicrobium sp. CFH 75288]
MRVTLTLLVAAALLGAAGWWVSAPDPLPAAALAGVTGDAERGAALFAMAGCESCHRAPDDQGGEGPPVLSGGRAFLSEFGTFHAPNISPSPQGIGDWTDAEIIQATMRGVSPLGAHYYPAFPYPAYRLAAVQDVADIAAFLRTLPESDAPNRPHEVGFPFNIRRGIGLWKALFLRDDFVLQGDLEPAVERGRYLVEALAHCGECHTPRNALGALDRSRWLGGAPNPSGPGRIPNITPGVLTWTEEEIALYLQSGFTPVFDVAGGEMAEVIRSNTSRMTDEDRRAIAAYLKAVPPVAPPAP